MMAQEATSEREVLLGAAAGDAAAVRTLLDHQGSVVYGFVFARVGGNEAAAEDVVQDTFLEAMRSAATFRGEAALSTWLCAIARRRLARHFEAERRQELASSGLRLVSAEGTPLEPALAVDDSDEVVRALGGLRPLYRHVLVLKYLDGCSVAEIAAELGRTPVQVQSLLQRARERLRAELERARG